MTTPYSIGEMRRAMAAFLLGKVGSALLTFSAFLLIVRLLPVKEYGAYVTLFAVADLLLAFSSFGSGWVLVRYLPELRLLGDRASLRKFFVSIFLFRVVTLVVASAFLLSSVWWATRFIDLADHRTPIMIFAAVLLAEGCGRHLRDDHMEPLLLQRNAQIGNLLRSGALVIAVIVIGLSGTGNLTMVAWGEFAASIVGATYSLRTLLCYHRIGSTEEGKGSPAARGVPPWRELWPLAFHMYLSQILTLAYAPQTFLFLVASLLGAGQAAILGFAVQLLAMIQRYLPADLLFGLIRPKLVASYVVAGGPSRLIQQANLAGKLSLFVLMPVLAYLAAHSEQVVAVLSGGKFLDTGFLLFGVTLCVVPISQRRILETVATTTGNPALCTQGSWPALLLIPLTLVLIEWGFGLWAVVIAMLIGATTFNYVLMRGLRRVVTYAPDWTGMAKLILSALPAGVVAAIAAPYVHSWLAMVAGSILCLVVYLVSAHWIRPFTAMEQLQINSFVKRPIFIW